MQYKTGTISVTNGSNVVTGVGTAWQTSGIISSNIFTKEGDNVAYSIASVDSDTQLTLTVNYGGSTSSGSNYGITIDFTPNGLPLLSSGDLNTDAIFNEAMLSIDNDFSSLGTASTKNLTSPSATIWDDGNLKVFDSEGIGTQRYAKNETGASTGANQIISGADLGNVYYNGSVWTTFGTLSGTWKVTQGFGTADGGYHLVTRIL